MKDEIRNSFLLTGFFASCIAIVLFSMELASPENSGWQFDRAGLTALILGLAAVGVAIILDIVEYVLDRRPWAATSDYRRLKNKTVRILREFVEDSNGIPGIDKGVLVSEKQMFIMNAESIGIDQGTAERDFECEIMGRVWR